MGLSPLTLAGSITIERIRSAMGMRLSGAMAPVQSPSGIEGDSPVFVDTKTGEVNCLRMSSRPQRLERPVRALLLDAGGVLYDDTLWRRWLLRLLRQLGLHTHYRCFFYVWDHDHLVDVYRGQRDFCRAFRDFLLSLGMSAGQADEVEIACRSRRRYLEAETRPLPGVKNTLLRLRESGVRLAVVTNSIDPASAIREHLDRWGIDGLFAAVVSSADLGQALPDPECYLAALESVEVSAEEAAYVGHDAAELAGARAVGMPAIAFNFDTNALADVYLARFDDLLGVVSGPASQLPSYSSHAA